MFNNIITDKTVLDIILASEEAKRRLSNPSDDKASPSGAPPPVHMPVHPTGHTSFQPPKQSVPDREKPALPQQCSSAG